MGLDTQSYEALSAALTSAGVSADSAEWHGGVCGSLCVGGLDLACAWSDSWVAGGDESDESLAGLMRDLEQATWKALNAPNFDFVPLLPDDEAEIPVRVAGLASWCHGFIAAIGLANLNFEMLEEQVRSQIDEVIDDYSEISRAAADEDEEASADAGFHLESLIEFVRAAAQLVFESLTMHREPTSTGSVH